MFSRCRREEHIRGDCPLMEVNITNCPLHSTHPPPTRTCMCERRYNPGIVRYRLLYLVHKCLVPPVAIARLTKVGIRFVHRDVHYYPTARIEFSIAGQKHSMVAGVSICSPLLLILGHEPPNATITYTCIHTYISAITCQFTCFITNL